MALLALCGDWLGCALQGGPYGGAVAVRAELLPSRTRAKFLDW